MNNTYKIIMDGLHCTANLWEKVSKDLSLVTVRQLPKRGKNSSTNFVIYYNGIFTGVFIKEEFIDLNELAECGIKFEGKSKLFDNVIDDGETED